MTSAPFDDVDVPPSLVERLVQLATERPDDVAVIDGAESLTYSAWTRRAGIVAALLPFDPAASPVAVLVDRSVRSVVAIVGVQWAGRPVVPLDATEPLPRLRSMLDRAGVGIVVDATGTMAAASSIGRPVIAVDVLPAHVEPIAPVPVDLTAISTIFFTSGSTGEPKAIVRTWHDAQETWRLWHHPRLLGSWSHVGTFAPLNFVGGYLFAILAPALGRCVTLVDLVRTPLSDLPDMFEQAAIDCTAVTPTLAHVLRSSMGGNRLRSVRHVLTFGEGLDWSVVDDIRASFAPDVTVQGLYGSSESLGITIEHTIGPDVALGTGLVPLGTPLVPDTIRLDALEGSADLFELVTVREVVSGYMDDAALSAARFGEDADGTPFWRSGDIVAVDDQGLLEFRCRVDDMIKLNGRLVEPAEAEAVLAEIDGVRRAVVIPHPMGTTGARLVAHLEVDDSVDPDEVRRELHERLPVFLVPSVLVRHDVLPMTERGKIDRVLLRSRSYETWRSNDRGPGPSGGVTAATVSEVEAITGIIATLLETPDLSPDDNLWHMGCDSLGALEILEVVNEAYDAELTADVFVTAATPRAIAEALTIGGERPPCTVFNRAGTKTPLHLVAGAGGPALQYRSLIWEMGLDRPVVVHEQAGLHQRMRRDRSIGAHAARSVVDVLELQPDGPYFIAGHSYGAAVALEVAARLERAGREVGLVLLDPIPPSSSPPTGDGTTADPVGTVGPSRRIEHSLRRLRHRLRRPWIERGRRWVARRRRLWAGRRIGSRHRYEVFLLRGDASLRRYRPSPFAGRTLVLSAEETRDRIDFTGSGRPVVVVPGGHTTMLYPPHVEVLAVHLRRFIEMDAD